MISRALGFGLVIIALMALPLVAHAVSDDNSTLNNDPEYKIAADLVAAERWSEALPVLLSLEAEIKTSADIYNLLGVTYRKLKDYPTSKRYYDRALEIDPTHLATLEYQGEWYLETGDSESARRNLARLQALCGTCSEYQHLAEAIQRAESTR
jgi:tetratricopeptide (TPR) repeat protein